MSQVTLWRAGASRGGTIKDKALMCSGRLLKPGKVGGKLVKEEMSE